jgi:Lrp/AsnC family leucine-responsive transcriptional regulator
MANMQQLDAIDKRLLSVLQRDGRISVSELADEVGMSASTCLRRLRQLEETELIKRYVAILDPDAVGLSTSVFVSVKLSKQPYLSGPVDYLLRVVVADVASFERFLKTRVRPLEYIASLESSFCLDAVKSTTALPIA